MSARANRFLIWRAGTAVNWDCTARDIALELGLGVQYVRLVCRQRGWKLLGALEASSATGGQVRGVDQIMTQQNSAVSA